jgi:hypothetical protein
VAVMQDKYAVLTLYREWDNICVVRLNGFDNTVFWKEIKLNPRFYLFNSPREKILKAQEKAARKAEKLKWADELSNHEFNLSTRDQA